MTKKLSSTDVVRPQRSRWPALVVLCAGLLMIVLDQTIVNVALPTIQNELGFTQSGLAWVVNAYLIAFGGLLLLAGRLGDLIGRRRMFIAGLIVFTFASLLCGLSASRQMLIAARFLQGAGGAMASAVVLGMIVTMFPDPREKGRALGMYSFVASSGAAIGLLAGGVLTEVLSWHWVFFVNLPIGIAAVFLALRFLDADRGIGLDKGADVIGAVLVTGGLMLGVYAIVGVEGTGWMSLQTLGLGGIALALLVGFFVRQARAPRPLLPLRIFRSRRISGANAVIGLTVAGLFGMFFLGTLYLQRVLGFDARQVGLSFLPLSGSIGVFALGLSPRLIARFGAGRILLPGLTLVFTGLALMIKLPVEGNYLVDILPSAMLVGMGLGLSFPSLMSLAMADVPTRDAGLASGLINTTQQVGGAVGLAVLVTFSGSRTAALAGAGAHPAEAATGGYRLAFAIAAGLLLVAMVTAGTVLGSVKGEAQP